MVTKLEADYLVVGAGAMGMAFTDVLMNESNATVIMVDKRPAPGGHWNDAYPFVHLHQPSAFYGVNSRELGSGSIDQVGWNKGLHELASKGEVCAYFEQIMNQQFLPSGRVQYFPNCEYTGEGKFVSGVTGQQFEVSANKIVDASYMHVTVPATRKPVYGIADGVTCVPVNDLPKIASPEAEYVIVGAGKTAMDACLWLLQNGTETKKIHWVMPRDSWLLDRANIQPGTLGSSVAVGMMQQLAAISSANTVTELFELVNQSGQLLRYSEAVWPTMYRCATVTNSELDALRSIQNVIRLGRVKNIEPGKLVMDQGELPMSEQAVYIDCSADGLEKRPVKPVFSDRDIVLQTVRFCQQVFSAAFIAHVECDYNDDAEKNKLCTVVPHPDTEIDFLRVTHANVMSALNWGGDQQLQAWLRGARLDGFTNPDTPAAALPPEQQEMVLAALQKLQNFIAEAEALAEAR